MGIFTVFTETLTMIGRDYNQRPFKYLGAFEHAQNRAQTLVGIGDLALVQVVRKDLIIGRRGDMRMVRIPVVEPNKERGVQVLT